MHRDTVDGEDDAEQWAAWMCAIHAHYGDNAFTVKQLAEAMSTTKEGPIRADAPYSLGEVGTASDRAWLTRLGKALHNHAGQMFDLGHATVKLSRGIADSRSGKKHYWLAEIN
jgi:hypothetical protein